MLRWFTTGSRGKTAAQRLAVRMPPAMSEPLERRLLMAAALARGGSGYSGTLSTNPTIRQQQLICDPDEPLEGSTSVGYDASLVTLRGFTMGPGYAFVDGFVGINNGDKGEFLQPLREYLRQPAGPESGYAQLHYKLNGEAGQLTPPNGFKIDDENGVSGIDTHAFQFGIRDGTSNTILTVYKVFAAPKGTYGDNADDFFIVNDGTGRRIGPADIAPTTVASTAAKGSISGVVFNDVDVDGRLEKADKPLADVTVFLDLNGDGVRQLTEPSRVSAANGTYQFAGVRPGTYDVRYQQIKGTPTLATVPVTQFHHVTVDIAQDVTGRNFGLAEPADFSGVVFADLNGDGVRQNEEPGLGGVRIFYDLEGDGTRDKIDPTDVSADSSGAWSLKGVKPGSYSIRVAPPPGFTVTTPAAAAFSGVVPAGQSVSGLAFGLKPPPSPKITDVFLAGSAWTSAFKQFLAIEGLGDGQFGYRLANGVTPLIDWVNVDRISLRFDGDVSTALTDLQLTGVSVGSVTPTSFSYDATTHTATWRFASPLAKRERWLVSFTDGADADFFTTDGDGDGLPGGTFYRTFDSLPADVDRSGGAINAADLVNTRNRIGRSAGSPGAPPTAYSPFVDVNGSGVIDAADLVLVRNRVGTTFPPLTFDLLVAEGENGPPAVRRFDGGAGTMEGEMRPFGDTFTGGVRVATGDLNGDGGDDLFVAPGPGLPPTVRVFDVNHGTSLRDMLVFPANFSGGVYVAAGDVDGDGRADVVAGGGAGSPIRVYSGAPSGLLLRNFNAFDAGFTGGVRVASGDVDGDGRADIVAGQGAGGGGRVRVFSGATGAPFGDFLPFGPGHGGGVNVGVGDFDGDKRADIIVGDDEGDVSEVRIFSGANGALLKSFIPFPGFTGGVAVAAGDVNSDGRADLIVGAGKGGGSRVRVVNFQDGAGLRDFFAFTQGSAAGVFVAAARSVQSVIGPPGVRAVAPVARPAFGPTVRRGLFAEESVIRELLP